MSCACSTFNSSLEHCSSLLCKGLTFNIEGVVYETQAVAKTSSSGQLQVDGLCKGFGILPEEPFRISKAKMPSGDSSDLNKPSAPQPDTPSLKKASALKVSGSYQAMT
jgi:hypothetical protein